MHSSPSLPVPSPRTPSAPPRPVRWSPERVAVSVGSAVRQPTTLSGLLQHVVDDVLAPTCGTDGGPDCSQLHAVARARTTDALPVEVWRNVAECLEVTGLALSCARDGGDPSASALLASCAMYGASRASAGVARELERTGVPRELRSDAVAAVRDAAVPVERSWLRLAGLLLSPVPCDVLLLDAVLVRHHAALTTWRRVLLGPVRLRRAAEADGNGARVDGPRLHQV